MFNMVWQPLESRPVNRKIKLNKNKLVARQLQLQFIHYCKTPNMTIFVERLFQKVSDTD